MLKSLYTILKEVMLDLQTNNLYSKVNESSGLKSPDFNKGKENKFICIDV